MGGGARRAGRRGRGGDPARRDLEGQVRADQGRSCEAIGERGSTSTGCATRRWRSRATSCARCPASAARPRPACCCSPTACATCPVDTHVSRVGGAAAACCGRARRSRSCTTRCSRSRRPAPSSSSTSTCCATAAAPATRSGPACARCDAAPACARRAARLACRARHLRPLPRRRRRRRRACPRALGREARFAVWDDPAVDWAAFDLVVVRSTWDYQERRDAVPGLGAGLGDAAVNPPDGRSSWNTDKRYLRRARRRRAARGADRRSSRPARRSRAPDGRVRRQADGRAGSRDTARFEPRRRRAAPRRSSRAASTPRAHRDGPAVRRRSVDERGETALLYFDGALLPRDPQGPAAARRGAEPDRGGLRRRGRSAARAAPPPSARSATRVLGARRERFGGASPTRASTSSRATTAAAAARARAHRAVAVLRHADGRRERLVAAIAARV